MNIDPFAVHQMLDEATDGVTVLYNGDCRGCGECCSRILPLSEKDLRHIVEYVRKHGIEQVPERGDIDMLCPYLSEDRLCLIYHARPDICRAYRCDMHAKGDMSMIERFMVNQPYITCDMRDIPC